MDMMTMVQRLTAVYGISGREAAVAEEIRRMAEPMQMRSGQTAWEI